MAHQFHKERVKNSRRQRQICRVEIVNGSLVSTAQFESLPIQAVNLLGVLRRVRVNLVCCFPQCRGDKVYSATTLDGSVICFKSKKFSNVFLVEGLLKQVRGFRVLATTRRMIGGMGI